jgi:hypothetical protein
MASGHIDGDPSMQPFVHLERCNNHDPENDLRSAILDFALTPACLGEHDDEDFPRQPYVGQHVKKEFEIHDAPSPERKKSMRSRDQEKTVAAVIDER